MKRIIRKCAALRKFEKLVRHRVYGIDRVKIWLDHANPDLPLSDLTTECGDVVTDCRPMPLNPRWKFSLSLHQPSRSGLRLLADFLSKTSYDAQIGYVELAADFVTRSQSDANKVMAWFLNHASLRNAQQIVQSDGLGGRTIYFHRRTSGKNGQRSRQVLTMYADRPTKLRSKYNGRSAAHVEFRFNGANPIENIGIFCLSDLVNFDHPTFWQQRLRLSQWISRAELGRLDASGKVNMSDSMLRRYADDFEARYKVNGDFVLQNAIIENKDILTITDALDIASVFKARY